jgi:hypothetical protein
MRLSLRNKDGLLLACGALRESRKGAIEPAEIPNMLHPSLSALQLAPLGAAEGPPSRVRDGRVKEKRLPHDRPERGGEVCCVRVQATERPNVGANPGRDAPDHALICRSCQCPHCNASIQLFLARIGIFWHVWCFFAAQQRYYN